MATSEATAPPSAPPAEILLVTTTVATRADAERLAWLLVEQRHAACVQLQAIEAVYHWDDRVCQEAEWRLLIKTSAARWPAARQALLDAHPYELPALAVWAAASTPAFAGWVRDEVLPDQDP